MDRSAKHFESSDYIDPVCGMTVSDTSEYRSDFEGTDYYFCSEQCEKKFLANPSGYLGNKKSQHETGHHHDEKCQGDHATKGAAPMPKTSGGYTCPMHPEVQSDKPGPCPKCGMALEPMGEPIAATRTEYTCPMHPEVIQDHPAIAPNVAWPWSRVPLTWKRRTKSWTT